MEGSLLSELLDGVGCGQLKPGAGRVWGGHALCSALRGFGAPGGVWWEPTRQMTKGWVLHKIFLCDPRPSEQLLTNCLAFLALVDTLWSPGQGLDSPDFTLGLAQSPVGTQSRKQRGLREHCLSLRTPLQNEKKLWGGLRTPTGWRTQQ